MREQERRRSAAAPPPEGPPRLRLCTLAQVRRKSTSLSPAPRLWDPSGSLEARSPEIPRGAEGSERALESSLGSQ